MNDPRSLKVGDKVRFVALPDEWDDPWYTVLPESIEFMKKMVQRKYPSRVAEISPWGYPTVNARMGEEWHTWTIFEKTGWRKVGT